MEFIELLKLLRLVILCGAHVLHINNLRSPLSGTAIAT